MTINTLKQTGDVVIADEDERSAFLARVYQHLALAVAALIVFEAVLFTTGLAERLYLFFAGLQIAWLAMLGGFAVVNWLVSQSVSDLGNPTRQYVGLFALAAAEAVIFAPFLYYVFAFQGAAPVWNAAAITFVGFGALSFIGLTTRRDLSAMRPLMMWGGVCALGLIIASLVLGFELGVWFSFAMIALAGGSILYQTQRIIRVYPADAHVAAAVSLFGSLMTMFWYVLRIMSRR